MPAEDDRSVSPRADAPPSAPARPRRPRAWLPVALLLLLVPVVATSLHLEGITDLGVGDWRTIPADVSGYDGQLERAATLQDRLAWLTPMMVAVTFLGDEEFYLLALPPLYWAISRRGGIRLGGMLLLTAAVNTLLKLVFATPRPTFLQPGLGGVTETSFGVPSGHAQNAVAIWGLLVLSVRRRWVQAVLVLLIAAIAWSRIHLGVHFLEDLIVGVVVGLALLALFLWLEGPVARWWLSCTTRDRMLAPIVASLALVAPALLLAASLQGVAFPWPGLEDPTVAAGASHVVTPAATLAGFGVGLALLADRDGFDHRGPLGRRALRVLVGLVGVVLLWQGLGAVLPTGESAAALAARYVRYALVGVWVGGLAPLLFVRLGLAVPAPPGALLVDPPWPGERAARRDRAGGAVT